MIRTGSTQYFYIPNDQDVISYLSQDIPAIDSSGWYRYTSSGERYNGGVPSELQDLTVWTIISQSYLDRVIQSLEENANT